MRAALFLRIVGVEAKKRMAYRADFWIQAFLVLAVELGLAWTLWAAIFRESGKASIGGFSLEGAVLYAVGAVLVAKLVRGADLDGDSVSTDIYEGGLHRYDVYPAPYFGFKYAQKLGALFPATVQFVLLAAVVPFLVRDAAAAAAPGSVPAAPSAATLAMGVVSILAGNLLYFLMTWCLHVVAFWADNVWSLLVALRFVGGLLGGAMLPLSVFPDAVRPALDVLPFRHCFAGPVETLLGRTPFDRWVLELGAASLWCLGFALLARTVYSRGRVRYSGVGL